MAIMTKVWEIKNGELQELLNVDLAKAGIAETEVEEWLEKHPEIISPTMLVIGRQVENIDLLGIEPDGTTVIIELKREKPSREVVAQTLDYAAWLAEQDEEQRREISKRYLKQSLEEAFQRKFGDMQISPNVNEFQEMLIVLPYVDSTVERIVSYLKRQGIQIDLVVFSVVKTEDNRIFLMRSFEEVSARVFPTPLESLLRDAEKTGTREVLESFRRLKSQFIETSTRYGISYYSRIRDDTGKVVNYKAVLRVDVKGDVRFYVKNIAYCQKENEDQVLNRFRSSFPEELKLRKAGSDYIVKVKTSDQADLIVDVLVDYIKE